MTKAVFLDRDGVVNVEKNYLYKIEDFEFIDGIFDSLKKVQNLGYKLFIITNQSGIGRGYYTKEDFEKLTSWMLQEFRNNEIVISQVELCPHGPDDNCLCRKPKTGMIDKILENYNIDLENSWLVGDKYSDIKCAKNAGILNTIQVKSGHKFNENESLAKYICESIKDIDKIIQT
ncbi:D-glycero-beta-D-manno-heptose-1,7-bisphosphate 7-phosphatase [Arcobacter sp. CECT 8989]|uniref:D-glycero-beta-D-manno-heptose 1,7-bisphosphate 7-phosphatase n=1 Tax=Arcobacter sp. CECT 8989 TaxID=2044509 RepID=UPI00100C2A82|nr:D-glycero-beta-D-manno-heptose 1,7-bisphosphate 7-phosphatase [Arcobacter sp. CECT 8989]RXK02045.1 D-glycero-beta-D-manno-heptose-1,7-bisphosphate 7-phosphatase [Arcobacter sp. CECT 8989]